MDRADIQLEELYGRSLWLRFLYDGLGRVLTVPGACLLWAVVQAGVFIALCWRQGTLAGGGEGGLYLLEDASALAYFFLLPACFGLLYYSLRLFRRYLNRLDEVLEPASLPESKEHLTELARASFSPAGMRGVRAALVGLGLLVAVYNAVINLYPATFYGSPAKWDSITYPLSYAVGRVYVFLVWGYLIPTWAAEVFVQLRTMARVNRTMAERRWVRVTPYALDRFGGLGGLAASASWAGYLVLAGSLFFLAPLLRALLLERSLHPGNYVGLAAYLVLAFVGVFAPVYVLHRVLARKREEMLTFLNGAFDQINARASRLVKENDLRGMADENLGRALETVDRLYTQWAALPSWPVSLAIVLKFGATVVIPAAGYFLVQYWLKGVMS